jgi:peptidoglycan DL-endopeptidase CwlO
VPAVTDVTVLPAFAGAPQPAGDAVASTPGFQEALRAAADPTSLPSVGLATMVAHRAGATAPAPATPLGATSVPAAPATPAGPAGVGEASGLTTTTTRPAGSGRGAAAVTAGERYLGVPYRWGGTSPTSGFDCSGFVQRAFADIGVRLPRVSVDQAREGTAVASLEQARPGDLVFWRANGNRPNHIGIYAGDGRMLVAPRTGEVVRFQEITRTPDGIRRIV